MSPCRATRRRAPASNRSMTLVGRRFIVPALMLGFPAAAPAQDPARVPNDPYFREQVSLHAVGGRVSLLRSSSRATRDTVTVAAGVALDAPRAWA